MNSFKGESTRFSNAKKVEIVDLVKKGKSRMEICKKFVLAPSTLQTFLRDEKKVEFENNCEFFRIKSVREIVPELQIRRERIY